ncbi:UDP-glucuronate 5'-epimerase [Stanieria cyanosphaera PCC 7437]|uniref:UDP-glucuronate 5'-epimerase n=1 Tax=Stanieria cyanosphaera (strain ATCC 29371 / PCC 7437) TaxID=111780 RepID=K9XRI7_STAC7|nr:NAD-dependent epimerase [Stanieria cyanosphaera]AFZ35128.1 UDP-glucuronate 5'-epimerase [Stanieria cyanosphaera PCC 7437]
MTVLITGVAGFIGYHLAQRFLAEGKQVYGIDNLNDYYDVALKQARLNQLLSQPGFTFQYLDISGRSLIAQLFQQHHFECVVHLAAQAGVRYSLENPHTYVDSNLVGFTNILEGCRQSQIQHLVFASSSSVYGANTKVPFSVSDNVDRPISLYAATKKANELMAHAYSHLYQIPITGLRFFTVYGAWGRPDMAYFKFVKAIAENRSIDVYNFGKMKRDFTYIDDVIEAMVRVIAKIPQASETQPPYKIYNLGNHSPVELSEFIETIEQIMGKSAKKNFLPMQPGDVFSTYADVDELIKDVNFKPTTSITQGMEHFIDWYREYYGNF